MNFNYKKIFYLVVLAVSFFTLGLVISNLMNEVFPACDFEKKDRYIITECAVQLILVYGSYIAFNKYLVKFIEKIFKNIRSEKIDTLSRIVILIAFSMGVYRHLDELNKKTEYLKNKFF